MLIAIWDDRNGKSIESSDTFNPANGLKAVFEVWSGTHDVEIILTDRTDGNRTDFTFKAPALQAG